MFYNKKFSNKQDDLFNNINKLPEVLVDIIQTYVPDLVVLFLNKTKYYKHHYLVTEHIINNGEMENFIRATIRQDNDFVFMQLLKENFRRWLIMKNYYYKNCIHSNYIVFLESYAIDNESTRCRKIISTFFSEQGLSKNQHKKNAIKYIRWRT
jgi:hypothetical protein